MKNDKEEPMLKGLKGLKIAIAVMALYSISITIVAMFNLKWAYENRVNFFYLYLMTLPSLLIYIYLYIHNKKKLNHIKNILW